MSGAVAVHSAYNGSGTQSLAVTNTISNDNGDVNSVFWNRHDTTKQLLHGSSLVEVVSSGAFGGAPSFGGSKIFNVNNDIDFMSDLYLHLDLAVTADFTAAEEGDDEGLGTRVVYDFELNHGYQFDIIERIDFMVGTQIWHTLSGHDIKVLTKSFCIPGNSDKMTKPISRQMFSAQGSGKPAIATDVSAFNSGIGNDSVLGRTAIVNSVLWIPGLTATLAGQMRKYADISENGYIQAAAPQQQIKIKVTFVSGGIGINKMKSTPIPGNENNRDTFDPATIGDVQLTGKNSLPTYIKNTLGGIYTNNTTAERGEILIATDNPLANGNLTIAPFNTIVLGFIDSNGTNEAEVDPTILDMSIRLENVRLFAKQIMFTKEERLQIRNIPDGLPWKTKMTQSVYTSVTNGEETKTLDLDSFSLYASHLIISGRLFSTYVKEIELKLNSSSFAGTLPAILLKNHGAQSMSSYSGKTIGVNKHLGTSEPSYLKYEIPDLVFPLASTIYSGSSIPLNRFDSIRMIIKFYAPATSGFINVTCVGETTTLYKGGSATLAMY